jgi:alpha-glucosidase (family GH31 glycosyl hydrolase)
LYLRSTAAAAFVPIMQYHSEFNHHRTPSRDRTPWNIAEQSGDDRVLPVFRRYAKLRERLIPYLAAQARESVRTSAPLMRALFFDHPAWEGAWTHPLQWMLGTDLFVSPVVAEGAASHEVALPPGEWVDVWTGTAATGPGLVTRAVPLDEIPVYCRAEAWPGLAPVFQEEA